MKTLDAKTNKPAEIQAEQFRRVRKIKKYLIPNDSTSKQKKDHIADLSIIRRREFLRMATQWSINPLGTKN